MSLFRFDVQGAIPPPSNPTEEAWLADLRARLRVWKAHCVVINNGEVNEENVTNFTFHVCHHDEGPNHPPCGEEIEI